MDELGGLEWQQALIGVEVDSYEVGTKHAECGKVNNVKRCFESADWPETHDIESSSFSTRPGGSFTLTHGV